MFLWGEAPVGLSNVVATLRSHRSAFAEQYPVVGGRNPPYCLALSNFCFPIDFAVSNSVVLYIESATIQQIIPMIA